MRRVVAQAVRVRRQSDCRGLRLVGNTGESHGHRLEGELGRERRHGCEREAMLVLGRVGVVVMAVNNDRGRLRVSLVIVRSVPFEMKR